MSSICIGKFFWAVICLALKLFRGIGTDPSRRSGAVHRIMSSKFFIRIPALAMAAAMAAEPALGYLASVRSKEFDLRSEVIMGSQALAERPTFNLQETLASARKTKATILALAANRDFY